MLKEEAVFALAMAIWELLVYCLLKEKELFC
jgi:hypothetical protein